jgi:hypothetical protein
MGEMRNSYKIVIGEPEGKTSLRRLWCGLAGNAKIDQKGIDCKYVDRVRLFEDMSSGGLL